jgi:uncharacterized protein
MIPARLSVVTLAAHDVPTLKAFYEGLGWPVIADVEDFAAFGLRGAVLGLYAAASLGRDTGIEQREPSGFTLAVNVERYEQVDEVFAAAREAGARVVKEPVDHDFGPRSGYFADPEDNLWEVAWVPPDSRVGVALRNAIG